MSKESNQQDQLLALAFGLLPEDEAKELHARIERDPVLAEAYAAIQADAEFMGGAAKLQSPRIALKRPEPNGRSSMSTAVTLPTIAGPEMTPWSRWAEWSLLATASLLVVFSVVGWTQRRSQLADSGADRLRVQVTGPSLLQHSNESRYQILTTTVAGRPVPTNVHFLVYSLDGDRLLGHTERTSDSGALQVAIPADLELPERIRIEFETGEDESRQVAECQLPVRNEPLATYVRLDRSRFAPGDTVRYRAVSLSRFHLEPRGNLEVRFEILRPKGEVLAGSHQQVVSEQGVAAGEFVLPADVSGGVYSLRVSSPDTTFPDVRREFLVSEARKTELQKDLEFAAPGYGPGMEVHAALGVTRRDGTPVSEAATEISVKAGKETIYQESTSTNLLGRIAISFRLPEQASQAEPFLVVTVNDGTVRETFIEPVPMGRGDVLVEFFPEGGNLAAVGENRVYFTARDSDGDPVDLTGWIVDEDGNYQAKVETVHAGHGMFRFSPRVGVRYRLVPEAPSGVLVDGQLPFVMPTQRVVLNTGTGVFEAGKPIEFNVRSSQAGLPLVAMASCRGLQVGEQAFLTRPSQNDNGRAAANAVAIPLPDSAAGVIRLTVFDYSRTPPRPAAERLVYRRPFERLDVALTADRETYVPGQSCKLSVDVSDEVGQPVGALLGLSVVDEAFLESAISGSSTMSNYFWLARQLEDPQDWEDADFLLEETPEAEIALDLLLGTQGWRRFTEPSLQRFRRDEMYGKPLGRWVELDADTAPPLMLDNLSSLLASADTANASDSRSTKSGRLLAAMVVLGGGGLLVLVTMLSLLKVASGVRLWAPAMVAVSASFLLVVLTISPDTSNMRAVAFQSYRPQVLTDEVAGPDAMPGTGEIPLSDASNAKRSMEENRSGLELADKMENASQVEDLEETIAPLGKQDDSDPQGERKMVVEEPSTPKPEAAKSKSPPIEPLNDGVLVREYRRGAWDALPSRTDFEPTVLWAPLLEADEMGQAKVSFDLSDAVTRYRAIADGHGLGRIGSTATTIVAKLPFHLSPAVPEEVSVGDRFDVPVAITDESSERGPVRVSLEAGDRFKPAGPTELTVTLGGDKRDRQVFSVEAIGVSEQAVVRFRGEAGEHVDSVERFVRIVPAGFPEMITRSGILEGEEELRIAIPEDVVPESVRATLTFYPSLAADLSAGLESIQGTDLDAAAARLLVADLLVKHSRQTAIANPQALRAAKARRQESLRRLADFQDSDGGYSRTEGGAPDAVATAGVLLVLQMDREVFEAASSPREKAIQWLTGRNDDQLDLTARAWRLWALAESGQTDLTTELAQVATKALEAKDAEPIALAVLATDGLGEEPEQALLDALAGQQKEDGYVTAGVLSDTEMTALAAIAWLAQSRESEPAQTAVAWLLSQRDGRGGYGSSLATALTLHALAIRDGDGRRVDDHASIALHRGEELLCEQTLGASGGDAIVLEEFGTKLIAGENVLRLNLTGESPISFTLSLRYSHRQRPDNSDACPLELDIDLAASKIEGGVGHLMVKLENAGTEKVVSPVAEIGLPASVNVAPSLLETQKKASRIAGYETHPRQLVLSWEALDAGESIELTLDAVAGQPGRFTGPPSSAYLAQNSEARVWAEPVTAEIAAEE